MSVVWGFSWFHSSTEMSASVNSRIWVRKRVFEYDIAVWGVMINKKKHRFFIDLASTHDVFIKNWWLRPIFLSHILAMRINDINNHRQMNSKLIKVIFLWWRSTPFFVFRPSHFGNNIFHKTVPFAPFIYTCHIRRVQLIQCHQFTRQDFDPTIN